MMIGMQLIKAAEKHFDGQGFHNINCCANGFQASFIPNREDVGRVYLHDHP